jgi:hypothetical protein
MEMKDLPAKRLLEGHEEGAPAKLAVVHEEHALIHVVVESFRHPVERSYITIKRTDDVKVTSRPKVRC